MQKDKHSRSGLVKSESLRKQGAGAHNWGSFKEDGAYRIQADDDAANEQEIFAMEERDDNVAPLTGRKQSHDPILDTSAANADVEGNKGIAHSPSDSMSSIDSVNTNKGGQRRMSNVSDEERERARVYREGVMGRGRKSATLIRGTELISAVDLAGIAKTSYGIAQSPPNNSVFGTSPTAKVSRCSHGLP